MERSAARTGAEMPRLHGAAREQLELWTERLRHEAGGRLLADRALSRLLEEDWPKTVDGFDRDE